MNVTQSNVMLKKKEDFDYHGKLIVDVFSTFLAQQDFEPGNMMVDFF